MLTFQRKIIVQKWWLLSRFILLVIYSVLMYVCVRTHALFFIFFQSSQHDFTFWIGYVKSQMTTLNSYNRNVLNLYANVRRLFQLDLLLRKVRKTAKSPGAIEELNNQKTTCRFVTNQLIASLYSQTYFCIRSRMSILGAVTRDVAMY